MFFCWLEVLRTHFELSPGFSNKNSQVTSGKSRGKWEDTFVCWIVDLGDTFISDQKKERRGIGLKVWEKTGSPEWKSAEYKLVRPCFHARRFAHKARGFVQVCYLQSLALGGWGVHPVGLWDCGTPKGRSDQVLQEAVTPADIRPWGNTMLVLRFPYTVVPELVSQDFPLSGSTTVNITSSHFPLFRNP